MGEAAERSATMVANCNACLMLGHMCDWHYIAELEAELGRVQLAHLRTCTELNTVRTQRDEARAALERAAEEIRSRDLHWHHDQCNKADCDECREHRALILKRLERRRAQRRTALDGDG